MNNEEQVWGNDSKWHKEALKSHKNYKKMGLNLTKKNQKCNKKQEK